MKILLIQPELNPYTLTYKRLSLSEPLALEIVASYLSHHEVKVLDLQIDDDLVECIQSFQPDVVGVTCIAATEVRIVEALLKKVKSQSSEIITVVGGHYPTLCPEDFKTELIDFLVFGEGEIIFQELVDAIQHGKDCAQVQGIGYWDDGFFRATPPRPVMENLDNTLLPDRETVENYADNYFHLWYQPIEAVSTSRGCPYRCTFCSVWKFYGGRYRSMSAERVVKEIENTKAGNIFFWDDNFATDVNRAKSIAKLLKTKGIQKERYFFEARSDTIAQNPSLIECWRDAGELIVYIGFETIKEDYLKRLNKKNRVAYNDEAIEVLHQNDATIFGSFIVDPTFSEEDFHQLREYLLKKGIPLAKFLVLTPLPGTDLYKQKSDEITTSDYTLFDMSHAVLPTRLKIEDFYKQLASLYNSLSESFTSFAMREFKKVKPANQLFKNLKLAIKEMNDYHSFLGKKTV